MTIDPEAPANPGLCGVSRSATRRRAGFLLLETMVGVAVFAIGVLALARCVNQCLNAEIARTDDQRARLALGNRMAEIEGGAVSVEDDSEDKLDGMFQGITLRQSRKPMSMKVDGQTKPITGLFSVELQALWSAPEGVQSKELTFYVFRPH